MRRKSDLARWLIAIPGALAVSGALAIGSEPAPIAEALDGEILVHLGVAAAVVAASRWVLVRVDRRTALWAVVFGVALAVADLVGISLSGERADLGLLRPSAWGAVHFVGTAYAAVLGVAAILYAHDRLLERRAQPAGATRSRWSPARVPELLRGRSGRGRWLAIGAVIGAIVLSRVPALIVWWPGLIFFDTYRSLSYAMGLGPWESYEPVGHSLLIAAWHGVWQALQLTDGAALALAASLQIVTTSAAFGFMMVRLAVWRVPVAAWWIMLAGIALLPVFSISSITVVKDLPFMSAFVVMLVCLADIVRSTRTGNPARWAWWVFTASSVLVIVLRNNGVYVVLATVLLLLVLLRVQWKRFAAVSGVVLVATALYLGPLATAMGVVPGPRTEAWSVPLQQVARIALDHHDEMSDEDRDFVDSVFTWWDVDEVGEHYIPGLSDPIKLDARAKWDDLGTGAFLEGWTRLILRYPVSAVTATLANTEGFWSPTGASYDGIFRVSWNDVRGISLDIPSDEPTHGLRAVIERYDLLGDGYRSIPIIGLTISPGFVTWVWLLAAVVLLRRRAYRELCVFLPALLLMATFLAGPVSGGMRYSLGLYATLPVAVGIALAARPGTTSAASARERGSARAPQEA